VKTTRSHALRLGVGIATVATAVLTPLVASATVTPNLSPNVGSAHILWTANHYTSDAQTDPNQLIYHGGTVETKPVVYLVFWGPEWANGFSVPVGAYTYTNRTAESYLRDFFGGVGELQRRARGAVCAEPLEHAEGNVGGPDCGPVADCDHRAG
jgi:hypothetical protein